MSFALILSALEAVAGKTALDVLDPLCFTAKVPTGTPAAGKAFFYLEAGDFKAMKPDGTIVIIGGSTGSGDVVAAGDNAFTGVNTFAASSTDNPIALSLTTAATPGLVINSTPEDYASSCFGIFNDSAGSIFEVYGNGSGAFNIDIAATMSLTGSMSLTGDIICNNINGVDVATLAAGAVIGPASAVDNTIARYDGTTGKLIQTSGITISDTTNELGTVGGITITGGGGTGSGGIYFPSAAVAMSSPAAGIAVYSGGNNKLTLRGVNTWRGSILTSSLTAARDFTLPDVSGTFVTTGDTGSVTNTMLAGSIANAKLANSAITINDTSVSLGDSYTVDTITQGTEVNVNSGTNQVIPIGSTGVDVIHIMVDVLQITGTDDVLLQLGTGSGIETTGYGGGCTTSSTTTNTVSNSNGYKLNGSPMTSAYTISGVITLRRMNASNKWMMTYGGYRGGSAATFNGSGAKTLSGALTQVKLLTSGSNTFTGSGSANYLKEI